MEDLGRLVEFRDTANRLIDCFMTRLPADKIPLWDFQVDPGSPRDTSSAGTVASALLELHQLDSAGGAGHLADAKTLLTALSSPTYLSNGTKKPSILLHGTGNHNSDFAVDQGLIWGDY